MQNMKDRISIQVGLSGYSFKIQADTAERSSGWMSAERIFTTSEFQRRYSDVEISVFTPKCTLVPAQFYNPAGARSALADVAWISESDPVDAVEVPEFGAVMIYSNAIGETLSKVMSETVLRTDGSKSLPLPELYFMLRQMPSLTDYNKILASYMDGYLYLTIAQGKTLLLCNSFQAPDFATAQYFIFHALKKLQLNPEVTTICFRTPLTEDQEMSLYRYFKSVESL
jgi:hypothetical protein